MRSRRLCSLVMALALLSGCSEFTGRVPEDRDKPFAIRIETRERWPEGIPLRIRISYDGPRYWDQDLEASARATYPGGGEATSYCWQRMAHVNLSPAWMFGDHTSDVGIPPSEATDIDFALKVRETSWLGTVNGRTLWSDTQRVPVRVGGRIEDIVHPVSSSELDQLFEAPGAVNVHHHKGWGEERGWFVQFGIDPPATFDRSGITFAVQVDVECDRQSIATASGWWTFVFDEEGRFPAWLEGGLDDLDSLEIQGDMAALRETKGNPDRWSLHITPRPDLALRIFQGNRYWSGDVRIPLVLAEERQ